MQSRNLMIFLLVCLVFSACRKDEIVDQEVLIETPPAEVLDVTQLKGIVQNRAGEILEDASIQLLLDNMIIAQATADEDGKFEFNDVILGESYLIYTQTEAYNTVISTIGELENTITEIEVVMVQEGENPFPNQGNDFDPLDENVIILSGHLTNQTNETEGTLVYISGEDHTWGNYTFSDNEGYFEIPVYKNEELWLFLNNECSLFENLGDFETDSYIGEVDFHNSQGTIHVFGEAVDCDGNPANEGLVIISSMDIFYQIEVVDGTYAVDIAFCNTDSIQIIAFADSQGAFYFSDFIEITGEEINHPVLFDCSFNNENYVNINLDGNEYEYCDSYASCINTWVETIDVNAFCFDGNELNFSLIEEGNDYVCLLYTSPSPRDS